MKAVLEEINKASHQRPIVIQFYADWCGPCRALKPTLEKLAQEADGDWALLKLNVEQDPGTTVQYQIKSIPTVVLVQQGEPVARFVGNKPEYIIKNWLDDFIKPQSISPAYEAIDQALRKGDVDAAQLNVLDLLKDQISDSPLLKILRALATLGKNDKEARKTIESMDRDGPLGTIIKKVRDLIDINEDERDIRTPTSSPYHRGEADPQRIIDVRAIDFELLNLLVHNGINEVRNSKGVRDLSPHPILTSAALDHNEYQIRFDQLTHYQQSPDKKSVKDRIISFGGTQFRSMGENVQYQGFPSRISGGQRQTITNSYHQTAQTLVQNWVNSPGHYRNLINPNFDLVGTAVGWNPENASLFATQVFGRI